MRRQAGGKMRTAHLITVAIGMTSMAVAAVLNSIDGLNSARPTERHLYSLLALVPGIGCLLGWFGTRGLSKLLACVQIVVSLLVTIGSMMVGYCAMTEWLSQKDVYGSFLIGTYCWFFILLPCGVLSFTLGLVGADERRKRERNRMS